MREVTQEIRTRESGLIGSSLRATKCDQALWLVGKCRGKAEKALLKVSELKSNRQHSDIDKSAKPTLANFQLCVYPSCFNWFIEFSDAINKEDCSQ